MSAGLYVYAIAGSPPSANATGLHQAPLRGVGDGTLWAIVSEHEVAPQPDEELLWAHEQVVEQLMQAMTILPLRFGTAVAGEAELAAILAERREEFRASLELVAGAVELGVRAQLAPPAPSTAEAIEEAHGERPGTVYLLERARRQRREEDTARLVHQPLLALARRGISSTSGGEQASFKGAYLVDAERVGEFGRLVGRLDASLAGASITCTGPWPPYSFVSEAAE